MVISRGVFVFLLCYLCSACMQVCWVSYVRGRVMNWVLVYYRPCVFCYALFGHFSGNVVPGGVCDVINTSFLQR